MLGIYSHLMNSNGIAVIKAAIIINKILIIALPNVTENGYGVPGYTSA